MVRRLGLCAVNGKFFILFVDIRLAGLFGVFLGLLWVLLGSFWVFFGSFLGVGLAANVQAGFGRKMNMCLMRVRPTSHHIIYIYIYRYILYSHVHAKHIYTYTQVTVNTASGAKIRVADFWGSFGTRYTTNKQRTNIVV